MATNKRNIVLLHIAFTSLFVAIVGGVLGFAGIAGTAAWFANVLFVVFVAMFIAALVSHIMRRA